LIVGVVCGLLLAGCGGGQPQPAATTSPSEAPEAAAPRPGPGDHKFTLEVGGKERAFVVHAPPGYTGDKPVPLVVGLHFYPGSGQLLKDMIEMDAKADEHGFLVAYPDGINGGFNALVCCGTEDDVAFLKALTDRLIADWKVDADRVYATGISNGADMSFRAAVEATGVFAAIGAVSGGFGGSLTEAPDFMPKKPVSMLSIIGDLDQYYETFQAGLTKWRDRLNCKPVKTPPGGKKTVKHSIAKCADGSDVEVYVVTDMGHMWPGATNGAMAIPGAPIVATDVIWDFFAAHPRIG
jgi:polyhydroxybutyrate depolymerase